jgi:hypothetical protein
MGAGTSVGRDVLDKLGLKPGQAVRIVGQGEPRLLARVRARVRRRLANAGLRADLVLYWPRNAAEVTKTLVRLRAAVFPQGAIWVVTAKRGRRGFNGMEYLAAAELIPLGLAAGLVDNKICSVSEAETAMRFVWRRGDRSQKGKG